MFNKSLSDSFIWEVYSASITLLYTELSKDLVKIQIMIYEVWGRAQILYF